MTLIGAVRLLAVSACAGVANIALAAVQVADDTGAMVTLNTPARRIVSLAPHATELLFAAGAGDAVVGVIDTSDWPPEARRRPRIGDAHMIDLERIVLLKPDLVVTWPYTTPAQVDRLRERGIAVFTTDPKTIDGIASNLERLGALVGKESGARDVAEALRKRITTLRGNYAKRRSISVFYEIWPAPLYTVGGSHLITQALSLCGARNVFSALTLPAPLVSIEAVLAAAPEAIVAAADDGVRPEWLNQWKRWPSLPAVARNNLLVADGNLLHRAGPRFIDGAESLCLLLDAVRQREGKPVKPG